MSEQPIENLVAQSLAGFAQDTAANAPAPPSPVIPRHPLDHPGVIKILLGRAASETIKASGDYHFVVITKSDCTCPPESADRLILICLPVSKDTANDASRVALGKAAAKPIRPSHEPTSKQSDT